MEDLSKAEAAKQQAELQDKFHNCTESIIKEWIAENMGKPVEELFDDYNDTTDVIGFCEGGKHYIAYVVTMEADSKSLVDAELLKNSEKARKACSMLFDAIRTVFIAVVGSHVGKSEDSEFMKNLMPIFIEESMAFRLIRVNRSLLEVKTAMKHRQQIEQLKASGKELSEDEIKSVGARIDEINKILDIDNQKKVMEEEEICKEINERIAGIWLHIVLEETDPNDTDIANESMKRLPTFGLLFQDPEEETYVDKLKKSLN